MSHDFFAYDDATTPGNPPVRAILADLADEDWDRLISFAARRRYAADAVIIRAQDTDRAIYFIVAGTVRIIASEPAALDRTLQTLGEGDVFGLQSFLDGAPRAASARADGPVDVLMLNTDMFEQLAAWQPRIAVTLLRDIGAHLSLRLRQHETSL